MSLGQYYDLTATGPTTPVPRDPHTHELIGLDNPHNYKAYYAHTFTTPATDTPGTKSRIWYQIDLPKFVKDFPELQEEYVSDRLTLRPVTDPIGQPDDDENPWDTILADLSQAAAEIKPLVKPTAYDLALEIIYHKQELVKYRQKHAQVLADRDDIFRASQSVLAKMAAKLTAALVAKGSGRADQCDAQRDDQQFLLDHNSAKRQAFEKAITISEKLLDNLRLIWSSCGYEPVYFGQTDGDDTETIKTLNLPEVITKEHVKEAKARLEAEKAVHKQRLEEAVGKSKPVKLLKLNDALAQGLVQPMPQDLLNQIVIGWYSDCVYEDIVSELHELQELKWHDKSNHMLAILQKYSNLITDLKTRLPAATTTAEATVE